MRLPSEELEACSDLRPCRNLEILGRAVRLYRERFGVLVGLSLLCVVLPECIELALKPVDWDKPGPSIIWIVPPLRIVGGTLFKGAVILVTALGVLGGKTGILNAIRQLRPALFLRMLGTMLVKMVFLIFLYLALVVPGLIYTVRWTLSLHVVVLEQRVYRDALRRSAELMSCNFWRYVGLIFPLVVLGGFEFLADRIQMIDLEEDFTVLTVTLIDSLLVPVFDVAITLLYFDIRVRNEGLDIEMIRKMIGLGGDMDESKLHLYPQVSSVQDTAGSARRN